MVLCKMWKKGKSLDNFNIPTAQHIYISKPLRACCVPGFAVQSAEVLCSFPSVANRQTEKCHLCNEY